MAILHILLLLRRSRCASPEGEPREFDRRPVLGGRGLGDAAQIWPLHADRYDTLDIYI